MATEIYQKYLELRDLQKSDRMRKAGAWDTEPDGHLEAVVKRGIKGEPIDWDRFNPELYSDCKKEKKEFVKALKDFYNYAIENRKHIEMWELENIKEDMWRVDWDWMPTEEERYY